MHNNSTLRDSLTPEIRALVPRLDALGTPACLLSTEHYLFSRALPITEFDVMLLRHYHSPAK
jgi:hypothetical protein